MNFYEVSPVGIVGKDFDTLTYSSKEALRPGNLVEISVGKKVIPGVIIKKVNQPNFETKEISGLLFDIPLPQNLLKVHSWISQFYCTHPGTVWQTMLPSGLLKNRRSTVVKKSSFEINRDNDRTNFVFTNDQLEAIDTIIRSKSGTSILHGVTGSGKTEVYKALALEAQTRNKSSIILVPEIGLTAQFVNEFMKDFDDVIVTHSALTEAQRFAIWQKILISKKPLVIIGPRSVLFMPVHDLGLVVIDECHEPSYTQEKSPRYNALRVASVLASHSDARLVLGSATPSIADFYTAKELGRPIATMNQLARKNAKKPRVEIIDLTKSDNRSSKNGIFSNHLIGAMEQTIQSGRQILLFHNRRGSASTTLCKNCGWVSMCPNCFLPLTLHADKFELRCHVCGFKDKVPTACPDCGSVDIIHRGIGTKRIEEEAKRLFPELTIKRFDGDTEKDQALQNVFEELHTGKVNIIVGTQSVAKGLDLPNLGLVGIVQADAGLSLPDFSAAERTFQLIAQATGRVGRGADDTQVIIQTYQPDAPAVIFGSTQNYDGFYDHEIKIRSHGNFPPFSHLMKLTCVYKTERGAVNAAAKLASSIRSDVDDKTSVLGPTPAFYERANSTYRWQIIVRSPNRQTLLQIAKKVPPVKWHVELDPISLL